MSNFTAATMTNGTDRMGSSIFFTRCDEDELPHLPNLANCKGEGYHCGWASEGTLEKSAAKDNLIPCDNGYHAWWKMSHLYREISEDTEETRFHPSLHALGELAKRNGQ